MDIKEYIKLSKDRQIDARGGNSKCYFFEDVVLLNGSYNKIDTDKIIEKTKKAKALGASICEILEYEIDNKQQKYSNGYLLQQKAVGNLVHDASLTRKINMAKTEEEKIEIKQYHIDNNINEMEILKNATQDQYNDFVKDWINIKKCGLAVDPSKTSNFFYDKESGFSFIDLDNEEEIDITKKPETRQNFVNELIAVIVNAKLYVSNYISENDKIYIEDNIIQILPKLSKSLQENDISKEEFNQVLHTKYNKMANKYLTEREKFCISLKSDVTQKCNEKNDEKSEKLDCKIKDDMGLEW